jgi:hypothetical protein
MLKRVALSLLLAVGALSGAQALDDNSTRAGEFTIHHNAFTTDTLNPEVAKAYGLQRSKFRGLLNVSVVKGEPGTVGTSTPAEVEVDIVTITGQKSRIPMRMIQDQTAIYYIGEFPVQNQQSITFDISVKPEGSPEAQSVQMTQQFFTE